MYTYRYTEVIKTPTQQVEHCNMHIEACTIKEKDVEKEANKLSICPELFRGKGPWVVCRSNSYPTMVFEHKDVSNVFNEPNIPNGYIKLNFAEGKGTLIYCRKIEWLASAERFVQNTKFVADKDYEPYLADGKIYEPQLMKDVDNLPEDKRIENSYVNWRVKSWKGNFILPQQYLMLGWGTSIHLLRIARIHDLTLPQAWDMMFIGRIEPTKKKKFS